MRPNLEKTEPGPPGSAPHLLNGGVDGQQVLHQVRPADEVRAIRHPILGDEVPQARVARSVPAMHSRKEGVDEGMAPEGDGGKLAPMGEGSFR